MTSPGIPTPSLCERCLSGLWGSRGWQGLNPEGAITAEDYSKVSRFTYEVTLSELWASVEKSCWWCELFYNHVLSQWPKDWPSPKPAEALVFSLYLETRSVHPIRINNVHVGIDRKEKVPSEGGSWNNVGIFTRSDTSADLFVKEPLESEPRFPPDLAQSWLRECLDHHTDCSIPKAQRLPSRVLDTSPYGSETSLQLIDTGECKDHRYVFMSYRWGSSQRLTLTSASLKLLQSTFSVDLLPQTLKDAVQATRSLGIRYLWVDALCILQDSPDDLVREIANMSDYVRLATVVIQPSGLTSVHDPFLSHPPKDNDFHVLKSLNVKRCRYLEMQFDGQNGKTYPVILEANPRWYVPYQEPIHSRGWVLQERMLCPRVLIFPSMGGMVWQCEEMERAHGKLLYGFMSGRNRMRLSRPSRRLRGAIREMDLTPDEIHHSWLTIVDDYSERDLTYPDDKLVAISALAKHYADKYGEVLGSYCAGVWYNFLDRSLHWTYYGEHQPEQKPKRKRAPSWSWAASDKNMFWMKYAHKEGAPYRIEILECKVSLASPELPFGQVKHGKLTVRAMLLDVIWYPDGWLYDASLSYFSTTTTTSMPLPETPPAESDRFGHAEPDFADYASTKPIRISYLPLFGHEGLLLAKQREQDEREAGATFIRVGICRLIGHQSTDKKQLERFKDRERRVVVIE